MNSTLKTKQAVVAAAAPAEEEVEEEAEAGSASPRGLPPRPRTLPTTRILSLFDRTVRLLFLFYTEGEKTRRREKTTQPKKKKLTVKKKKK